MSDNFAPETVAWATATVKKGTGSATVILRQAGPAKWLLKLIGTAYAAPRRRAKKIFA
jgi:hypothetical protein